MTSWVTGAYSQPNPGICSVKASFGFAGSQHSCTHSDRDLPFIYTQIKAYGRHVGVGRDVVSRLMVGWQSQDCCPDYSWFFVWGGHCLHSAWARSHLNAHTHRWCVVVVHTESHNQNTHLS